MRPPARAQPQEPRCSGFRKGSDKHPAQVDSWPGTGSLPLLCARQAALSWGKRSLPPSPGGQARPPWGGGLKRRWVPPTPCPSGYFSIHSLLEEGELYLWFILSREAPGSPWVS